MKLIKSLGLPVVLAIALAGCSGDHGTGPSGVDTRISSQALAPQQGSAAVVVMGTHDSTVDVLADWTSGRNDVNVYATSGDCIDITSALSAFSCVVVAQAISETAKPERLTFSGVAGSSYKVFLLNRGPDADTVTLTVSIR